MGESARDLAVRNSVTKEKEEKGGGEEDDAPYPLLSPILDCINWCLNEDQKCILLYGQYKCLEDMSTCQQMCIEDCESNKLCDVPLQFKNFLTYVH